MNSRKSATFLALVQVDWGEPGRLEGDAIQLENAFVSRHQIKKHLCALLDQGTDFVSFDTTIDSPTYRID